MYSNYLVVEGVEFVGDVTTQHGPQESGQIRLLNQQVLQSAPLPENKAARRQGHDGNLGN